MHGLLCIIYVYVYSIIHVGYVWTFKPTPLHIKLGENIVSK